MYYNDHIRAARGFLMFSRGILAIFRFPKPTHEEKEMKFNKVVCPVIVLA